MVIGLKKNELLINKATHKAAANTATNIGALALCAVLASACVGTKSASVFDDVTAPQSTQTAQTQNLSTAQQPTQSVQQANTQQASQQPAAQQTTSQASTTGFKSVPIASRLPAPIAATNYLPSDSSILEIQGAKTPDIETPKNTSELALGSLEDSANDQTSLSLATATTPIIDPIEAAAQSRILPLYQSISHGKCPTEWGPKPKRVEARRINPGDPYYVEIRMRNTPLMPVGHTFVVYGKLDGNGEPLSERMAMLAPLGGYAGAGIAAAIPVPGVLTPYGDDCKIRPETAYRVSLNAQRYEKFLLALKKVKKEKPVYMLFAQNCNHFTQRMADSVGILPPKNKYVPAVEYLYDMIEANEGIKINTRYRSKIAGVNDWPSPTEVKKQQVQNGI